MHHGSFANFSCLSNVVTMQMSYTPNSVVARVREFAVPELVPLLPVITSSNLTICWIGESNKTYRLEFNPDLGLTNWFADPVISYSNKAWIIEALTTTNRFYRVRVLP